MWRLPAATVSVITNQILFLDLPERAAIRSGVLGDKIQFVDENGDVTCTAAWLGNDMAKVIAD